MQISVKGAGPLCRVAVRASRARHVPVSGTTAGAFTLLAILPGGVMQTANLIVNPGGDAAVGGTGQPTPVVPGWTTIEGAAAVVTYGSSGYPASSSPGPADRGANFLGGGDAPRTRLTQQITLPMTAQIDAGTALFDTGGWLGGYAAQDDGARLSVEFLDAAARPLGVVVLGPVTAAERGNATGLLRRAQTGTVPPGSRTARVLLLFTRDGGTSNDGYADSLWLTLSTPAVNLLANPGGDAGPGGTGGATASIPGWTHLEGGTAVIAYGTSGYPTASSPGPANRGANFLGGGTSARSRLGQSVALPNTGAIDAGTARYDAAAWLGGYADQNDTAQLSVAFRNAAGQTLSTVVLGPVTAAQRANVTGMLSRTATGTVPVGSRTAQVELLFVRAGGTSNDGYADSLSLSVSTGGA
ncbi:hypothetical protein Cme02nite_74700 [Catellatospora methionotrophica]|uniref:Uncharacterized protein n=1 Tax=Catellatospora methionotrophica TaxID=121620 RepID=A0A8J3LIW0_9ACTN|nr:hypothetical protein [Catellatospora methionotrophica]GIG19138.1 hypothetical protein Cme02nite_74700 [Catellatospora methionotrophica]